MPRHPDFAASVRQVRGAVYSKLAHRLASHRGEVYPLHVGDTWMEPPEGCRMEDLTVTEHPGMHRYAKPRGNPELLDAVAARVTARTGVATSRDEVLVTGGATGGLGAAVGALVDPGDEVLLLAPHWPLISGIVRSFHGVPVAVPFLVPSDGSPPVDSAEAAVAAVEAHRSERTVALYISTPSNPTGGVIPRRWLEALVAWARRHDLWILADEVYEDYVYDGEHTYCRTLDPERTFSAHSFSKALGMAGNRIGYVAGPARAMDEVRKVSTHTVYSASTAGQLAALAALEGPGEAWIERARDLYRELGYRASRRLGVPAPAGSTFLFLDVTEHLDGQGVEGLLERCVDRGLLLAPGESFGPYPTHVRLCFTSAPPEVVGRGVEVLAELLER